MVSSGHTQQMWVGRSRSGLLCTPPRCPSEPVNKTVKDSAQYTKLEACLAVESGFCHGIGNFPGVGGDDAVEGVSHHQELGGLPQHPLLLGPGLGEGEQAPELELQTKVREVEVKLLR